MLRQSLLLFIIAITGAVVVMGKECGIKSTSRIVGGVDAYENEFPWQVSWRVVNQTTSTHRHVCGASIIGDRWVLTAAHCVDLYENQPIDPKNFLAMVGAHSQSKPSSNQKIISVKSITVHSGWDSQQIINDMAVVELSQNIGLDSSNLNAICLGRATDNVEGRNAVFSGWGLTTTDGSGSLPDILQRATTTVELQSRCKSLYSFIKPLSDGEVCAGKNPGGCNGDSGGPLQYEIDGRWYQLGAASWVVRCGSTVFPTVWARVPYFLDFIESVSGITPP